MIKLPPPNSFLPPTTWKAPIPRFCSALWKPILCGALITKGYEISFACPTNQLFITVDGAPGTEFLGKEAGWTNCAAHLHQLGYKSRGCRSLNRNPIGDRPLWYVGDFPLDPKGGVQWALCQTPPVRA